MGSVAPDEGLECVATVFELGRWRLLMNFSPSPNMFDGIIVGTAERHVGQTKVSPEYYSSPDELDVHVTYSPSAAISTAPARRMVSASLECPLVANAFECIHAIRTSRSCWWASTDENYFYTR